MNRSIILLLALLLAACASTDDIDLEPKALEDFAPLVRLDSLWSAQVGAGQDGRYTRLVPALAGDAVFAADIDGEVFAFDKRSGKQLWSVALDIPLSAGVGVGANTLLLGSYKGELLALSQDKGELLWRTQLSSELLSEPQAAAGVVVASTSDGRLYGLDGNTGTIKWQFESVQPLLTLRGTSAPLIKGDTVYAAFDNGKIYAFDLQNGLLQWEQRVAIPKGKSELERMVDIDGTPALGSDLLYVASYQGRLAAFASATGRPLWAVDASAVQGPAADAGQVYLADADGKLLAYGIASGSPVWENADLLRRKLSPPASFGDFVAVADYEGYVHLLKRDTGAMAARIRVDGDGVRSAMKADGDLLYVLGAGGELAALRIKQ